MEDTPCHSKQEADRLHLDFINLWLTAIYSVFNRVTADRQTHNEELTTEHCIAAIGLCMAAYVGLSVVPMSVVWDIVISCSCQQYTYAYGTIKSN